MGCHRRAGGPHRPRRRCFNAYRHYPWAATPRGLAYRVRFSGFQCLPALSMGCHFLLAHAAAAIVTVSMPTGIIHGLPQSHPPPSPTRRRRFNAYRHYPWAATPCPPPARPASPAVSMPTGIIHGLPPAWGTVLSYDETSFNAYRHYPWAATIPPDVSVGSDIRFQCLPALSMGCHRLLTGRRPVATRVSMPTGIIHGLPRRWLMAGTRLKRGFNAYRHYPWAATHHGTVWSYVCNKFQCLPALSMGCHVVAPRAPSWIKRVSMPTGIIHGLPRGMARAGRG